MEEIWKDIKGYEQLYQISNFGNVRSLERKIIYSDGRTYNYKSQKINNFKNKGGYCIVGLYRNNKQHKYLVHRLVYETFVGEIPEKMQVNHIDENPNNNRLENLNLMTSKENINWGNHSRKQKLSQAHKTVLQFDLNGNFIKEWNGVREIETELGYFHNNISKCCKKAKHHTKQQAYGYIWKYKMAG